MSYFISHSSKAIKASRAFPPPIFRLDARLARCYETNPLLPPTSIELISTLPENVATQPTEPSVPIRERILLAITTEQLSDLVKALEAANIEFKRASFTEGSQRKKTTDILDYCCSRFPFKFGEDNVRNEQELLKAVAKLIGLPVFESDEANGASGREDSSAPQPKTIFEELDNELKKSIFLGDPSSEAWLEKFEKLSAETLRISESCPFAPMTKGLSSGACEDDKCLPESLVVETHFQHSINNVWKSFNEAIQYAQDIKKLSDDSMHSGTRMSVTVQSAARSFRTLLTRVRTDLKELPLLHVNSANHILRIHFLDITSNCPAFHWLRLYLGLELLTLPELAADESEYIELILNNFDVLATNSDVRRIISSLSNYWRVPGLKDRIQNGHDRLYDWIAEEHQSRVTSPLFPCLKSISAVFQS